MTSLNASLPFSPMLPGGQPSASIGTSDPTSGHASLNADEPTEFLALFLAHLQPGGIEPNDSPSPNETTDLTSAPGQASPSPVASMLQANGFLQASVAMSDALGMALSPGEPTTDENSVELEPKTLFKKWMAATPNSIPPILNTPADVPQPTPTDISQHIISRQIPGEVAPQDVAPNAGLSPMAEKPEPVSMPGRRSRSIDSPFTMDHAIQTADGTASPTVPSRPAKIGDRASLAASIGMTTATPANEDLIEATPTDTDAVDNSAADDASISSAHAIADADADGINASVSAAEPRRLSNHSSVESISRHDEARPTPLADQVGDSFRAHLDQLQQQGRVDVRMEIHPPELGHMQLHMTMQDNQLSVRMVVTSDMAKQVLEQQLEPLRIRFAEMGVNLGQLDVGRDSNAAHRQPASDSERSSPPAQTGRNMLNRPRSPYLQATNPSDLVDVIT